MSGRVPTPLAEMGWPRFTAARSERGRLPAVRRQRRSGASIPGWCRDADDALYWQPHANRRPNANGQSRLLTQQAWVAGRLCDRGALAPPDSPDRPNWLNNLGITLRTRFERVGNPADLDAAIEHIPTGATTGKKISIYMEDVLCSFVAPLNA